MVETHEVQVTVQGQGFETMAAACRRVGLSRETLYRWAAEGRLHLHRPAGCRSVLVSIRQLDALILGHGGETCRG